jgi:hypothetical protein
MTKEIKDRWINIRITPTLLEKLKAEAEKECRSIAGQALFIIEKFLNTKEK